MKTIQYNILIQLLILIQVPVYAQPAKNMQDESRIIPLKIGANPITQFKTLEIAPINLFAQTEPLNNDSPHIQLELNVAENNSTYSTFLWRYEANDCHKTNYPKAMGNYVYSLETNQSEINLTVEKLDFGVPFFIDLNQSVSIGNLTARFEQSTGEWSEDIDGNQTDFFSTYIIVLSDKNDTKELSFTSLSNQTENEFFLPWKDYKIVVLCDAEKSLKLIIHKMDKE